LNQFFKELQLYLRSHGILSDFPKEKYKWWAAEHIEASRHPDLQELPSKLTVN
jgi:hypothetical protein